MADIAATNWSETDDNNNTAAPDGFPEGMAPSGVNNGARAVMGAVKRFWNKINAVKTTGGTTSAYTLTFDVAPAAYADGEIIAFVVNAANAAAATLNVNALGAIPLRLFAGSLLAGALQANQIVRARYNSSAGAFDIIPQNGLVRLGEIDFSAASTIDFTSIPAGVNNLRLLIEGQVNTDGASVLLRTYGADGVVDSGSSDYYYVGSNPDTLGSAGTATGTSSFIALTAAVDSASSHGFAAAADAANIQSARYTKFTYQSSWLDVAGSVGKGFWAAGIRQEADRITGIRITTDSGTITGKATLFASA